MKYPIIKFTYKNLLKRIFFRFDPELVHDSISLVGKLLGSNFLTRKLTSSIFNYKNRSFLEQNINGVVFNNPVGLSAGFDKEASLIKILPSVGFGFMTVGSVTYSPYKGNPHPRLFRLKKSKALVVYYGLKNAGIKKIIPRILKSKKVIKNFPLSISIAKTNCKDTNTEETGIEDYYKTFKECLSNNVGNIYEINVSCPNTFGGEPFTTPESLKNLLKRLASLEINAPVFIKMPINLNWNDFKALLDVIVGFEYVTGVTIGNLNKDHASSTILDVIPSNVKGGISGKPTWELSNNLIEKTYKDYGQRLKIIGVGGIFSAEDAYHKIKLGSSIVELITGMIFEGPQLIGDINKGLVKLLKKDGFSNISQAVGVLSK